MALSADGRVALVGAPSADHQVGAAFVFVRSGSGWKSNGKLVGQDEVGKGDFGSDVALSADGRTAFVGATADNGFRGAVWVFRRTGAGWVQQGAKLTARGEAGTSGLGYSIAVSDDGTTLLAGGPFDRPIAPVKLKGASSGRGAAWVFVRGRHGWQQQGGKLVGAGATFGGDFGGIVALSGNGTTALVGGPYSGHLGGAWVFNRVRGRWLPGPRLRPNGTSKTEVAFSVVSLDDNGHTAAVGGPVYQDSRGGLWIFARTAHGWRRQAGPLHPRDEVGRGAFGQQVALSADGDTVVIGGFFDGHARGAAWLFTRHGSRWAQQGRKITAPSTLPGSAPRFGSAVALSADARTAILVGGAATEGFVWVYRRV